MRNVADGKVVISTALDNGGLTKGLKGVSGALGGLKGIVAGLAVSITAAFATATVAITKQAVEAYADYEQLVGGVVTIFKDSAAKVASYAEDAFYTANLSANEYMETVTGFSASLINSLKGDTEKAADVANMALIDMADNANKMGSTMESIQYAYQGFAKQNYTMLDNLKLGYGGTKTEMERLLRDAEAFSGVKYNIGNLSDVYNAIHAIQEKLGIAGATAEEAEKTITGSANMTKAAWKNVLTAIAGGGDLDKAMNNLVFSIAKYFKNIVPVVQRSLSGIGQLIEEIAPALVESVASALIAALPNLLNAVYQMIVGLAKGIYQGIVALFTGNGVTGDVEKQLNGVASSAGAAAGAEKDLADGISAAGKAAKKTLAGFDELRILQDQSGGGSGDSSVSFPGVSGSGTGVETGESAEETVSWLDAIVESFKPIKKGFEEAFTADIPKLQRNWKKLTAALEKTFSDPKLSGAIEDFRESANEAVGSVGGSISSIATSLSVGVVGGTAEAADRLEEFNQIKLTSITGNLESVSDSVSEISKAASEIATAFEGDAAQGIVEFFAMITDQTVMEGLDAITGFFSDQFNAATQPIADNSEKIRDMLDKVFQIVDLVLEPAKELLDKIAENTIAYEDSLIHQFFQEATEFGSSGLGGALDEINKGLDGLIELIGGEIDFEQWFEEYVEPAFSTDRWEDLLGNVQHGFAVKWAEIEQWWDTTAFGGWWNNTIAPWFTVEKWSSLLADVKAGFETEWAKIETWWETEALGGLWDEAISFFDRSKWESGLSGLAEGFETAFTDAANAAIGVLNELISWINQKLNFTIPELNILGKQLWPRKYVTLASVPSIPYLAQGAVLPANKPFLAMVGDQKHGTNVEAPLSTIQEAVALVMQDMIASNMAGHEATVAVLREILEALLGIQIGDEVIAAAVDRYRTKMAVMKGG